MYEYEQISQYNVALYMYIVCLPIITYNTTHNGSNIKRPRKNANVRILNKNNALYDLHYIPSDCLMNYWQMPMGNGGDY